MTATSLLAETDDPGDSDDEQATASEGVLDELNLSVPASADRGEAAAIAAAIGAHLRDRAAAAASADEEGSESCDRWSLCGRLDGRTPPQGIARGEEWKTAGRLRR
ncbi:hypothetical protein MUK72_10230 [Halococcus dombrowskii]|uniref:Acc operon protein n=1 Tax=Halococcus dombrowskii TaxID=179637 RepID=A0AAV3SC72_HALDO|nr:hypothetical protein [Halococcus dombrowskii]UOO94344.1 hypothetical protein MUK72_10230 [Halococcus dombrowskii]